MHSSNRVDVFVISCFYADSRCKNRYIAKKLQRDKKHRRRYKDAQMYKCLIIKIVMLKMYKNFEL